MDGHVPMNITTPDDFWALWDANQAAFAALGLAQGAERSGVAALALLVWDILTTLDTEVQLIWPTKWTIPKALYLFVRYYSLITLIFHNIRVIPCVPWLIFEILSSFAVELAAEVIIILRVYAIFSARKSIMRIMLVGFVIQAVVMAVSLGVSMPKLITGFYCDAADLPVEMVLYSTASIIFESFLFALMMAGVIRGEKDSGYVDTLLLRILVRDGAIVFVGVFLAMLLNTILFTLAPTTLVTAGFPWLLAILGAGGSRLVLNLRAQHANIVSGPSSIADVKFASPTHVYTTVNLDEEFEVSAGVHGGLSEDAESDCEHIALSPSRRHTGSSANSNGSRARSARMPRYTPLMSDVELQSPNSPLSPARRLPR